MMRLQSLKEHILAKVYNYRHFLESQHKNAESNQNLKSDEGQEIYLSTTEHPEIILKDTTKVLEIRNNRYVLVDYNAARKNEAEK